MQELFESQTLKNICKEYGISYLGLFGSHARKEATSTSDVDLLVEFNKPVGYFELVRTQSRLSAFLGKEVDLVTKGALSARIYPFVQKDLKKVYGA